MIHNFYYIFVVQFYRMTTYEDEFNEKCYECDKKMSNEKLTEEEYDEHEDREIGIKYIKGECNEDTEVWYCKEHREEEEEEEYCFKDTTIDSVETDICFCSVGGCDKPTEFDEDDN